MQDKIDFGKLTTLNSDELNALHNAVATEVEQRRSKFKLEDIHANMSEEHKRLARAEIERVIASLNK